MNMILAIVIIVVIILALKRNASELLIEIDNGQLEVTRGKVTARTLRDFSEVVRQVKKGKILGDRTLDGIELRFKGDIDEATAQRLRNLWGINNT